MDCFGKFAYLKERECTIVIIVEYKGIKCKSDVCMSDTRLPWRDSRDNLQRHRYAPSEQGDVTSNPVRIHEGDSRKDGPGNPRNLVVASGENSFIRTTRRGGRGIGRLLSRYCSMYNNLGAAHTATDMVRLPSCSPSAT